MIGFPSIGETLKFFIETTGILASGRNRNTVFESEILKKKSFQKKMQRLANEDVKDLNATFREIFTLSLKYLHKNTIKDKVLTEDIIDILFGLYQRYRAVIKDNGTFVSKEASIKWYIKCESIHYLVFRITLAKYKNFPHYSSFDSPDTEQWFLPQIKSENNLEWPLKTAMDWMYEQIGLSQTQFHHPGKLKNSENYRLKQNLENAQKWRNGRATPRWADLEMNLDESFFKHVSKPVPSEKILQYKRILFIALFMTRLCRTIENHLGNEFMAHICQQFSNRMNNLEHDVGRDITELMRKMPSSQSHGVVKAGWEVATEHVFKSLIDKTKPYNDFFQAELRHRLKINYTPLVKDSELKGWEKFTGKFDLYNELDAIGATLVNKPPSKFRDCILMLDEIIRFRKEPLTKQLIEDVEKKLSEYNLRGILDWQLSWLKWHYHRDNGKVEETHHYAKQAFEQAKYKAGLQQEHLVREYIQWCKFNSKLRDLKKATCWAKYLKIETTS